MDYSKSTDEISAFESFYIMGHRSSLDYRFMNSYKNFKHLVKNESDAAFKINAKAHYSKVTGKSISQAASESLDYLVDHPEVLQADGEFLRTLKILNLYPNTDFPEWNQHIEIYNNLEKNNFSNADEMYLFLEQKIFFGQYQNLIHGELLIQREFNIFLILSHLDSLIFNEYFQSISIYKYLLTGKTKGKRKSPDHLFWNLVKIIACTESNNKIGTSFDLSIVIPKDENSLSLVHEDYVERIIYAVRQVKTEKRSFIFLSQFYQMVGAKKINQNTHCFKSFSITGLWLLYIYTKLLQVEPKSNLAEFIVNNFGNIFSAFDYKNRSKSTNKWPSDLLNHK